jgi:spore germination protein KA
LRRTAKLFRKKQPIVIDRLEEGTAKYRGQPLPSCIEQSIDFLQNVLGKSSDVIIHRFEIPSPAKQRAVLAYIDGLVKQEAVNDFILRPLLRADVSHEENRLQTPVWERIPMSDTRFLDDWQQVLRAVLSGDTVVFFDQYERCLSVSTKGWEKRGVEEPSTESVVRGPRDGLTETLRINTAHIRRRVKDPNLRVQNVKVGYRTDTDVAILYIEDIANPKILQTIRSRIENIEIDGALESGYIEQFIEDHSWSPFPQIQNTERPDKVAASLLEGKIAILVDGTPFALIAPAIFSQFYNSPEDYYERFLIATLIRFIRIISMLMALMLPSLYIAFSSFHPEMIPSKLVIAMAAGRATVPFPSVLEAFLMEVTMEILREASVRLPGPVGPTIGIVGALVVGESAVRAGIVSPIMVIIVALTTIGSFASPSYSAAISLRMLRFPMMLFSGTFGLYGVMLFLIIIIIHLCSLESFGVPYLTPWAPRVFSGWKDTFYRTPLYRMLKRPQFTLPQDSDRMPNTVTHKGKKRGKKGDANEQTESSDRNG